MIFFDDRGRRFAQVGGIVIDRNNKNELLLSPDDYTSEKLLHGSMEYFYNYPPARKPAVICRHIPGQFDIEQVHTLYTPPEEMYQLHIGGSISRQAISGITGTGAAEQPIQLLY